MAPDLNHFPPSTSDLSSSSPRAMSLQQMANTESPSPASGQIPGDGTPPRSPRSASLTLQAAATLNAGLQRGEPIRSSVTSPQNGGIHIDTDFHQHAMPLSLNGSTPRNRHSPSAGRRRSQVLMNLQLADNAVPAPGEMVSEMHSMANSHRTASPQAMSSSPRMIPTAGPRHSRTPSLGELHQNLENEQEFHVNRLLQEIRRLRAQLMQQPQQPSSTLPCRLFRFSSPHRCPPRRARCPARLFTREARSTWLARTCSAALARPAVVRRLGCGRRRSAPRAPSSWFWEAATRAHSTRPRHRC
jgi:hypothetical protein